MSCVLVDLAEMDEFRNLDTDIEGFASRWKKFVESEAKEKERFPQEWKKRSTIQKRSMRRCTRPDRKCYGIRFEETRTHKLAQVAPITKSQNQSFFSILMSDVYICKYSSYYHELFGPCSDF